MAETRRFMPRTARTLVRLLGPAPMLGDRLKRTAEYRLVAALKDNLEPAAEHMACYPHAAATHATSQRDAQTEGRDHA